MNLSLVTNLVFHVPNITFHITKLQPVRPQNTLLALSIKSKIKLTWCNNHGMLIKTAK